MCIHLEEPHACPPTCGSALTHTPARHAQQPRRTPGLSCIKPPGKSQLSKCILNVTLDAREQATPLMPNASCRGIIPGLQGAKGHWLLPGKLRAP